jgi:20S proteasome subunit beta 1
MDAVMHQHSADHFLQDVSLGTTIMAVAFDGGVILGADSRTSSGSFIANRTQDKITPLGELVYMCRSGSASDTQAIATYVQYYIAQHQMEKQGPVDVSTAAQLVMQLAYSNKNMLQAGLIVAGWDAQQVRRTPVLGRWCLLRAVSSAYGRMHAQLQPFSLGC